jgi:hypothetical protein
MFEIGDIVTDDSDDSGMSAMYIISDFAKYIESGEEGFDFDCELIQIYPITKKEYFVAIDSSLLTLQEKWNSVGFKALMKIIEEERNRRGMFGQPEYLEYIRISRLENKLDNIISSMNALELRGNDVIEYDSFETIDECLDAINDLNILIEEFGDETYIGNKELTIETLKLIINE